MEKESVLDLAKKKSERERRNVCVHKEEIQDLQVFYVTPEEKAGDNVSSYEHVTTFEPKDGEDESFNRVPIRDSDELETGDRVIVEESVHIITEVTTRQIVTNLGDKFRKSDGVEWGGGEKQITHKLVKQS